MGKEEKGQEQRRQAENVQGAPAAEEYKEGVGQAPILDVRFRNQILRL